MSEKYDDEELKRLRSLAERALIEQPTPDSILKMIDSGKFTAKDIADSYICYGKMLHFIEINLNAHIKYDCKLLCDMLVAGEYDNYIKFLDDTGIEHRI